MGYDMFGFLGGMIENEPGRFVGPLSRALGWVFNLIFELFNNNVTISVALGLSIIVITFLMRTLILPLGIKSHKSMMKMHRVAPEMDALKKKYEGKTDPELKRKMQMEIQELYRKNNVNPLMGCLPALATMPVFIGLNFIMRQAFMYVDYLRDRYYEISQLLIDAIPAYSAAGERIAENFNFWHDMIVPMLRGDNALVDVRVVSDMSRAVSRFSAEQWDNIREFIAQANPYNYPELIAQLNGYLEYRDSVESFLGLNMVNNAGWGWPGVIIPVLAAGTTALSSFLMQRANKSRDPSQKMQQRIMLIAMPLFFGFITATMPLGVGFYWVVSNSYQVGQHYILTKYYANKPL